MSYRIRDLRYLPISRNAIVLTEKPGQGVDADLFYFTSTVERLGNIVFTYYILVGINTVNADSPPLLYSVASDREHPEFRPFMLYNHTNKEIFSCTESTDKDPYMHCYATDISRPPPSATRKVIGPFLPPMPPPGQGEQNFGLRYAQVIKSFEDEIHILATAGSMRTVVLYRVPGFEGLSNPRQWAYKVLVYHSKPETANVCDRTVNAVGGPYRPETRAHIVGYDSELGYLMLAYRVCNPHESTSDWIFKMFYYDPATDKAYDLDGRTELPLPIDIASGSGNFIRVSHPERHSIDIEAQILSYNVLRDNSSKGQGRILVPLSSVYRYYDWEGWLIREYARAIVEVDEKTKRGTMVYFEETERPITPLHTYIHGKVDDNRALVTLRGYGRSESRLFDIREKRMTDKIVEGPEIGIPMVLLGTTEFNLPIDGLYLSSGKLIIADKPWSDAKKIVTDLDIVPVGTYSAKVKARFWEAPQRVNIEVISERGTVEQSHDVFIASGTSIEELININTSGVKRFRLKVIS